MKCPLLGHGLMHVFPNAASYNGEAATTAGLPSIGFLALFTVLADLINHSVLLAIRSSFFSRALLVFFSPSVESMDNLPYVGLGRHLGIVLLEPLAQSLAAGHVLLDTARHATVLTLGNGLGGEVVDAGVEAGVDKGTEELRRDEVRQRSCAQLGTRSGE